MSMKTFVSPSGLRRELEILRRKNKTIGFVPTMGALHNGHLALVRRANTENDITVVSIFVNPTQFGPHEDFKNYPRPIQKDKVLLQKAGVDFILLPKVQSMYPKGHSLFIDSQPSEGLAAVTEMYCGASRPGHYRGVLTVCAKLFSIVRPDRVYMGVKDYQQTIVIERLIQELHMGIKLVRVPTVREPDGLALSSRNAYLSGADRSRALMISKTLFRAAAAVKEGRKSLSTILRESRAQLSRSVDKLDYFEAADPETLETLTQSRKKMVLLTGCYVGKTRLIDNVIITARNK